MQIFPPTFRATVRALLTKPSYLIISISVLSVSIADKETHRAIGRA